MCSFFSGVDWFRDLATHLLQDVESSVASITSSCMMVNELLSHLENLSVPTSVMSCSCVVASFDFVTTFGCCIPSSSFSP